jgi:hypothetical protein
MGIMKKLSIILATSLMTFAVSANADISDSQHQGLQAAYDANTAIVADFQSGVVATSAQNALNVMVARGIQILRDIGEGAAADQFESEWNSQFTNYLTTNLLFAHELGDHEPLLPWLANYYNVLNAKTDGIIKAVQIVQDINTMNYALGVVLRPNGSWRTYTDYDRIEYRKHFIPMADIITYWTSLELCKHYITGLGKQVCGKGATELETLMGRYVAPELSDYVWARVSDQDNSTPAPAVTNQFASEQDFENSLN